MEHNYEAHERETLKDYSGEKDVERKQALQHLWDKTRELLEDGAIRSNDLDFAIVAHLHATFGLQLSAIDEAATVAGLLPVAREAHRRHPSSATASGLITALMAAGLEQAASSDPDVEKVYAETRKAMGAATAAIFVLQLGGSEADTLMQQTLITEALGMVKARRRQFQKHPSLADWAATVHADPQFAAELGVNIKADRMSETYRAIQQRVAPMAVENVLKAFWYAQLEGDTAEAQRLYETAREKGVPVPELVDFSP